MCIYMRKNSKKNCTGSTNTNIINLVNVNKDLALKLERQSNLIVFLKNKKRNSI